MFSGVAFKLLVFAICLVGTPAAAQQAPAASGQGGGSPGSFGDRLNNFFFGTPAAAPQTGAPDDVPDCPTLDVRQGASTLAIYGAGETTATNLRYQASIGQMARECAFLGATLTIKVGVQGRILLGPAGGPGQMEVPLRMALVHEGPEPKTLWTKLTKVRVNVPAGQTNVTFTHVEEDLTVPKPRPADIDSYIIYVGFDQLDAKKKPPKVAGQDFKERPLPTEGRRNQGRRRGGR